MQLLESRHYWLLRDDSHLICLLPARLFNASLAFPLSHNNPETDNQDGVSDQTSKNDFLLIHLPWDGEEKKM